MEHRSITIGERRAELYASSLHCKTIIYLHSELREEGKFVRQLEGLDAGLVLLPDVDWNGELSPWPAAKVFRDGEDFSGKGQYYLQELITRIIPAVEVLLEAPVEHRGIAGYSLAGLFAVYALWDSPMFDRAASISGSLWYDGFLEYLIEKEPICSPKKVYFSLGDREKQIRNPRMARVEKCMKLVQNQMKQLGAETIFVHHPGGHFNDVSQRIAQGIRWVLE